MKNIFINESQYNALKNAVLSKQYSGSIFNDKVSSLSSILSAKNEEKLLKKRESEVYEIVSKMFSEEDTSDSNTISNTLSKLLSSCIRKEKPLKEFLEKLCYDSVFELFECPDGLVNLTCSLVNKIDDTNVTIHINPTEDRIEFDDSTELDNTETEVQKRMLLNTLIIGASVVLTKTIIKEKKNEINKLDNSLYNLYRKILWLNEYHMFQEEVVVSDEKQNQAGGVDVKLGTNKKQTIIDSKALCFPVLLFETIKGFFELFISHGLPTDKNIAEYVIDQADSLKFQQYSIAIGPVLWNRVMTVMYNNNIDTAILPHFMVELSKMDLHTFNDVLKEVTLNTTLGKQLIKGLIDDINNNIEYEDFQERLDSKRREKNIINDNEYMSEEELLDDN